MVHGLRFRSGRALAAVAVAVTAGGFALVSPHASATAASAATVSAEPNRAQNGFSTPRELPASAGLGEPTIIHDSKGRLYVTAPQSLGNVQVGGSPLYTSTNGGSSWQGPVRSPFCSVASGGDTDLVTDGADNIYATDLWLGNSCMSVSEDRGKSFAAGNPFGSELQPGDDRPWLAYDRRSNQIYTLYDGADALHAASTGPLVNPAAGVQAIQDNVVVPESAISSGAVPAGVRACVCPPGGIAIDNSSGAHSGRIYASYSHQGGVAISYADITGACPACTAATWTGPIVIRGSGTSGSAFENEWNFAPVKVDSHGTVYVMWAHAKRFDAANNVAAGGVTESYAWSKDGGVTWHGPYTLSAAAGTTAFPTMDVVAPGVIDVAWYGATAAGDPNAVPAATSWNVDYARVTRADTTAPSVAARVAVSGIHTGCIQVGGAAGCTDRSLLDFFQLTDVAGIPNIIYAVGDATRGVNLFFTKLTPVTTPTAAPRTP